MLKLLQKFSFLVLVPSWPLDSSQLGVGMVLLGAHCIFLSF